MSSNSNIEWTETTWNVTTGCTEASTGCNNCYARTMTKRLGAMARADTAKGNDPGRKANYELAVLDNGKWSGVVTPVEDALTDPLKWRKPRRIFVNSMSDLFWGTERDLADARRRGVKDPQPVPFEFLDKVFAVMALTPQHTYQVLTKRPERMAEYLAHNGYGPGKGGPMRDRVENAETTISVRAGVDRLGIEDWAPFGHRFPLPNVWLGTSVENQAAADERIPHLLKCPAAVRWLSCEPLLGAVYLGRAGAIELHRPGYEDGEPVNLNEDFPPLEPRSAGIHWVVVGGESGSKARPMHPDWARSLRDQCATAGVPYFFKQWGEWAPGIEISGDFETIEGKQCPNVEVRHDDPTLTAMGKIGKKAAGRLLDGVEHNAYPEVKP